MSSIIKAENLTFIYGKATPFERRALDNVSLNIDKGEYLGIIGRTGSGKSTLIQHLNGLLRPQEGRVYYDGEDIWENPKEIRKFRFKVGLVFQYPEYQLFEETVFADVAFGPKNMKLDGSEISERVEAAIKFVGLSNAVLSKSPFELSGGEKRRVAIAGVIAMRPEVLILDEPTAGLDPQGCCEIMSQISEYHQTTGSAVVLVTHSMEEIARWVQRIVVLENARVHSSGTPSDVFSKADELEKIGLDVPQVTRVMLRLRELGFDIDASAYTVEQARDVILAYLGVNNA